MAKKSEKSVETAIRRVVKMNGAFYCNLPKSFVTSQGLHPGDPLALVLDANKMTIYPAAK